MAGFRALWDSASKAFQNSGLSEPGYLQRDGDKVIPEMRLFSMLYSDPITPCFKIFSISRNRMDCSLTKVIRTLH